MFQHNIRKYKHILFVCSDYPGYGGAATNCNNLVNFFKKNHKVQEIYHTNHVPEQIDFSKRTIFVNRVNLHKTLKEITFKPDLIILKNTVDSKINLKSIFPNTVVYYLIPGLYKDYLNKNYKELSENEYNKFLNKKIIRQISSSDLSFCNSSHVQDILKKKHNIDTKLFYSTFIKYYNIYIQKIDITQRKYDYGLIVSDFNRKIKNIDESISFLKNKDNVILIGNGSSKYKSHGFECIELVKPNKMDKYYQQIKYIVQDSFFESCSNVKIEALMNGCKIKKSNQYVICSTQYPYNGGAATLAYHYNEYLLNKGIKSKCVFFLNNSEENFLLKK